MQYNTMPHTPARLSVKKSRRRRRLMLYLLLTLIVIIAAVIIDRQLLDMTKPKQLQIETAQLHPIVRKQADELVRLTQQQGIRILITDGFRSAAEQDALYRKGRSDEGSIVTKAKGGQSYHNFGLAVDFALLKDDGSASWEMNADLNGNGKSDWQEVVAIAKSLHFEWGGDWSNFPDYPHLQMTFGYSIRELQRGADLSAMTLEDAE
ncbi:M15 family metallopeptidase [Paenibacillus sp. MMS18-CY102]|uniref:M15 family metallopeptidase n=1 Tax=Paenibacillus sp. MMS18-CY102 TaxID=2682849 RepID=UPI0013662D5A|nr:M15 family peptidase [Paenibacillus sp. MMS18-CY102]